MRSKARQVEFPSAFTAFEESSLESFTGYRVEFLDLIFGGSGIWDLADLEKVFLVKERELSAGREI